MLKKLLVFLFCTELLIIFFYKDFIGNQFNVHFIDVGQGDATLIQAPYGCQILIDGGKPHTLTDQIKNFFPSTERDIDLLIATHPDLDHYGGLQQIAERYKIHTAFISNHSKSTIQYQKLLNELAGQKTRIFTHFKSQKYILCNIQIDILYIDSNSSNGSSVISLFTFPSGQKIFLGGDIEYEEEALFVHKYPHVKADILKANHHGSHTSNTSSFLDSIQPQFAVISAKKDNHFGHPHSSVLNNFNSKGIKVLRTDLQGTISFSFE